MSTHDQHADAVASWAQETPVPARVGDDRLSLILESLAQLRHVRRQVRAFLSSGLLEDAGDVGQDAVDDAVMVIDELTSNALRHGTPPSMLHVRDEQAHWTVVVTDSAPTQLPTPARGRVEGAGGYGLYMVTDLTGSHGVHYEPDRKLVWALLVKPPATA